jgi:DNA-binding MarR family transcriptional regulator
MANVDDAYKLVSPQKHKMEILYADYANSMKSLANKARVSMKKTENLKYDKNAAKIYAKEVSELEVALNNALKNSVKERQATRLAAADLKKNKSENPDMKAEDERKAGQRAMTKYREEVGSVSRRKRNITITDKQWEAIQAGAISENKLKKILANSDPDILREKSMPKTRKGALTTAQVTRIKAMAANGNFTIQQIADKLGISKSAVSNALKGAR